MVIAFDADFQGAIIIIIILIRTTVQQTDMIISAGMNLFTEQKTCRKLLA